MPPSARAAAPHRRPPAVRHDRPSWGRRPACAGDRDPDVHATPARRSWASASSMGRRSRTTSPTRSPRSWPPLRTASASAFWTSPGTSSHAYLTSCSASPTSRRSRCKAITSATTASPPPRAHHRPAPLHLVARNRRELDFLTGVVATLRSTTLAAGVTPGVSARSPRAGSAPHALQTPRRGVRKSDRHVLVRGNIARHYYWN